ncbi:hypothetical protein Ddc_19085 [Ditylenchus destructor]|nr:hypothetical protein Ddc_19085 [Ditylenchus destructor]
MPKNAIFGHDPKLDFCRVIGRVSSRTGNVPPIGTLRQVVPKGELEYRQYVAEQEYAKKLEEHNAKVRAAQEDYARQLAEYNSKTEQYRSDTNYLNDFYRKASQNRKFPIYDTETKEIVEWVTHDEFVKRNHREPTAEDE